MPRKKTPKEKAEVTGRTKKNPGRFKDRNSNVGPTVGEAPSHFTDIQKAAWEDAKHCAPWVTVSHRPLMIAFSVMYARLLDPNEELNASFFTQFRGYCSTIGITPTDVDKLGSAQLAAARVYWGDEPDTEEEGAGSEVGNEPEKPKGASRFFHS